MKSRGSNVSSNSDHSIDIALDWSSEHEDVAAQYDVPTTFKGLKATCQLFLNILALWLIFLSLCQINAQEELKRWI